MKVEDKDSTVRDEESVFTVQSWEMTLDSEENTNREGETHLELPVLPIP